MTTRTISVAGGNWDANGTWDEGSPPDATMDVVARSGGDSGNFVVNQTTNVCKSLDLTNYAGQMSYSMVSKILGVSGNVTLGANMTFGATMGQLSINDTATLKANGKTWPGTFVLNTSAKTNALNGDWTNTGLTTISNLGAQVLNKVNTPADKLICNGGYQGTGPLSGTALIYAVGAIGSANYQTIPMYLNGNVTCASTLFINGPLTRLSGTWTGAGYLQISVGAILDIDQITPASVYIAGNYTLLHDLNATLVRVSTNAVQTGAFNINCTTYRINMSGDTQAVTHTLPAGQSINVTNLSMNGNDLAALTLKSATPGSPIYLNVSGPASVCKVYRVTFTDVNASGGNPVYNWFGSGTNTNIVNVTPADIGGAVTKRGFK